MSARPLYPVSDKNAASVSYAINISIKAHIKGRCFGHSCRPADTVAGREDLASTSACHKDAVLVDYTAKPIDCISGSVNPGYSVL